MGTNFGSGVSRVLNPDQSSVVQVIIQKGKPPMDAETNLMQQMDDDWRRLLVLRGTPSGFLGNATNMSASFLTSSRWSNWFRFGQQQTGDKRAIEWAVVNGWLVPVTGTLTGAPPGSPNDTDTWNRITLDPPPANSGDTRIDFVFLEVWLAKIAPNPNATNKPAASGIYRYGNVEGGYSFLADDLKDPALGYETAQRVQLQYRIRVVSGLVGLASFPDGFDTTNVKGRGAAAAATSYVFQNMRKELGDPGLWRAGDGTANALGTVDGYTYAIPIAAVFRRNSVTWDGDPSQNLNGSFNRNPTATDRTGYKTFVAPVTLTAALSATATSATLSSVSSIDLPTTPTSPVTIQIGDEILTYSIITGTTMTISARGALGSRAEAHAIGSVVKVISGRPDGLFADQVASTDILDLRHAVNPNGFDADTLLAANLDKLLRGELRANWKRSGGGPQGPFVVYQDKISNSPAALGVTKLDGPDNQRVMFSDAAVLQQVGFILTAPVGTGPTQPLTTAWGLSLTATSAASVSGQFTAGDVITLPVAQLKTGIPGGDADQVRYIGTGDFSGPTIVRVRIDGDAQDLVYGTDYTMTPADPTPTDNLLITLASSPNWPTTRRLFVDVVALVGPGRGMSRRPDAVHSVAFLSSGPDILTQQSGIPSDNIPMRAVWAPLWSKYRKEPFNNLLPVTAEAYVDPGSKTIILQPFRKIDLPDNMRTRDGTSINVNDQATPLITDTGSSTGTTTWTADTATYGSVAPGDVLVVNDLQAYRITAVPTSSTLTVNRTIPADTGVDYVIYHAQGLMPLNDPAGSPKWTTTDPLNLFRGATAPDANTKNVFLPVSRSLVPGWGEVRLPIIHTDTSNFDEGINFLVKTTKGSASTQPTTEKDYVPMSNGSLSYAPFSTMNLNTNTPSTFNAAFTYGGNAFAGIRFFTDSRSLGRQGLELPPFYGIARLFAVYEAQDYKTNGSGYDPTTREALSSGATNLLKQNLDGPAFWIEIDDDLDSTFVLNADVIDITKSPNTITSFAAGNYVVEASIFGFDRGSFDLDSEFRLVLTRESTGLSSGSQAGSATRANNFGTGSAAFITSPDLVLPGPAKASDEVAINYSRTPYQGDAWGSQTSYTDIGYTPGPLSSGMASQIATTDLDQLSLTRPNQKVLEVLASTGFVTSLGTGRIAGDQDKEAAIDFRQVGFEDPTVSGQEYPPSSGLIPRPRIKPKGLHPGEASLLPLGTEYHGCTERLPMGALYRDKDFRGGIVGGFGSVPLFFGQLFMIRDRTPGLIGSGVASSNSFEHVQLPLYTSNVASGAAGEVLVAVDGEQGNYSLLTNYRTHRGGSLFSASAPRPGGDFYSNMVGVQAHPQLPRLLGGVAMLVRNTVTNVGSAEVSAGDELMMLIVTTVTQVSSGGAFVIVLTGTNGTAEGYSATDLYRIEGRPLVRDHVKLDLDPSSITLSKSITGIAGF